MYPLSPTQQGVLFQTLYAPESGVYCEQWYCTIDNALQVPAFKRSWQRVLDRHTILRTAFNWQYRNEPFQIVYRHIPLSWQQYDWRSLSAVDREQRLKALPAEDRQKGFNLSKAPLMRMTLIRATEDTYQFLWSCHHLLLDGWSLPLILREVTQFYNAFSSGQDLNLDVCRSYGDYIAWLQQQDLSRAEAFWRQLLQGFVAPTPLPYTSLYTHEAVDFTEQHLQLPGSLSAELQMLAKRHRLSFNTLVQGAWALLLSRYSGMDDIVFGATVSGRSIELTGVESMVGLFINALPVRVRVMAKARLIPWLHHLQSQQVEARQYEFSPLAQIQAWSEVPPGLRLFESLLVFQNYPGRASLQEWGARLLVHQGHFITNSHYPLTLVAIPGPTLALRAIYQRQFFDDKTISRMLHHVQTLLKNMLATPEQQLADLDLLTHMERHQLLSQWNDTQAIFPQDICIHQQFETQVTQTPDAVAVVYEGHSLIYRVLNVRANQLAHHLQKAGVRPEILVGICVERSIDMVIGLLGILKAGGTYLPLEPEYPTERLGFIVSNAQIPVLVIQQKFKDSFPDHDVHIVCIDTDWHRIAQHPKNNPVSSVTPENLAYVMYTSGSTGIPKGVMISHRALSNHLCWMQRAFPLTAMDRVVQKTSLSFDASVWECFAPLSTGSQLIIARAGGHQDSTYLVELLVTHHITMLKLVPSLLQMLLEGKALATCPSLRHVFCGGEILSPMLQERFFTSCDAALHNLYGPTEATIDVTCWTCERGSHYRRVPIGRPIANTDIYLLDTHLQPVPMGMSGEVYIGGESLARGYLSRPELTAETFIPNPFSDEPGARLYKTGDLARYLLDGTIEFLGRLDYQVKIRGYRVELGEIEATLERHPAVRQAVVLTRQDVSDDRHLVAYIVTLHDDSPTMPALRSFLQATLPHYMIPVAFERIDAFPLTPSGKVDRQSLPIPDQIRPVLTEAFVDPRNPIEEVLVGIWSTVLGIEAVGVRDNFFELGGHSLLAMRVISRLRQALQVEVPLRTLFDTLTIEGLARHIDSLRQSGQHMPALPLRPVPREGVASLAIVQKHFWGLDRLLPGAPFSNMSYAVRLTGILNTAAMEKSFNEIIKRHEVLRTTFRTINEQPMQVIAPHLHLPLLIDDLRILPQTEREAEVQRLIQQEALYFFDLTQGPLLRVRLLRLGDHEHILLMIIHHIVSDGWSIGVMMNELSILYDAFSYERSSSLPELSIQYADFVLWQHQWLHSKAGESQLAYWLLQLQTPPTVLQIPTDHPRTEKLSLRTARVPFQISETLFGSVSRLSRQEGCTVFMTLIAAFNMLLYGYTGLEDIRVATLVANRRQREIEDLIGPFVNLVICQTNLSDNPKLREVLRRVRTTTLAAYTHQEFPFEELARTLQRRHGLDRLSLFQVMFTMIEAHHPPLQLSNLESSDVIEVPTVAASACDLAVTIRKSDQGLLGSCIYKTALFEAATITRILEDFCSILSYFVDHPEQNLSIFSSL